MKQPPLQELRLGGCAGVDVGGVLHAALRGKGLRGALRVLSIAQLEATDATLRFVAGLRVLESLNVSNCRRLSEHGLLEFFRPERQKLLPNLRAVRASAIACVTDAVVEEMAKNVRQLTELCIDKGCLNSMSDFITRKSLVSLGQHASNLEVLEMVYRSFGVSDTSLLALTTGPAQVGKSLRELNLDGCDNLTDAGVGKALAPCAKLEALWLDYDALGDDAVIAVARHCPDLRMLCLSHGSVSDRGADALAGRFVPSRAAKVPFEKRLTPRGRERAAAEGRLLNRRARARAERTAKMGCGAK